MTQQYKLSKGKIFDIGSEYSRPKYVHNSVVNLYAKSYKTKNIQTIMQYMNAELFAQLNHLYRIIAKEEKTLLNKGAK